MNKPNSLALLALSAVLTLVAPACAQVKPDAGTAASAARKQSGFVTVKGRQFQLDGKPYYFAGANLWYGMYLGSPGTTGDRARLDARARPARGARACETCACWRSPSRAR